MTPPAVTLWGKQRKHHNFSTRSSDTCWAVALTDQNTREAEPQQHTDQPSELKWIYCGDKLFFYPCAATILRVSEDLGRDSIIFIIIDGRLSFGVLQRLWGWSCRKSGSPSVCQSVTQHNASEPNTSLTLQTDDSPGLCL